MGREQSAVEVFREVRPGLSDQGQRGFDGFHVVGRDAKLIDGVGGKRSRLMLLLEERGRLSAAQDGTRGRDGGGTCLTAESKRSSDY